MQGCALVLPALRGEGTALAAKSINEGEYPVPKRTAYLFGRCNVVARDVLKMVVILVPVGRVLECHAADFVSDLAFEKTREEREAPLGAFRGARFCLISH